MPATITGFLDVQPTAALPREVEVEARADAALIKGASCFPKGRGPRIRRSLRYGM